MTKTINKIPTSVINKEGIQKKGNLQPTRTLGPVPDLERHLPPEWWKDIFNSLYEDPEFRNNPFSERSKNLLENCQYSNGKLLY